MPRISSPRAISACDGDERRRADDLRVAARSRRGRAASRRARAPSASATSTCEITESMRSRTSFWKPFITDRTMISAATPRAMPSIETPEMNEMKPFLRPARPARV